MDGLRGYGHPAQGVGRAECEHITRLSRVQGARSVVVWLRKVSLSHQWILWGACSTLVPQGKEGTQGKTKPPAEDQGRRHYYGGTAMYDTDRTTVDGSPSSGSCTVSCKGIEWGEKFIAFHNKNPQVYLALVQYAHQWKQETGLDKIGLGLLWERVRWDLTLAIATNQRSSQEYRLNDGFKSFYSRLMMMREPSLRECFDLRRSEAGTFLAENLHRCK